MSNSLTRPGSVWRRILASSQALTNPKPGNGSRRVSIPSHDTTSPARKQRQKQRWFKELQKWRTGCEGRHRGVLKRRHGLRRSLCCKGPDGIQRWVGLGVIADNVNSYRYPQWPSKHARAKCPLNRYVSSRSSLTRETDFLTRLSSHPQTLPLEDRPSGQYFRDADSG